VPETFACRDDCDFPDWAVAARCETEDEVVRPSMEHGRRAHGMTDEQIRDPAVEQGIRSYIRGTSPVCGGTRCTRQISLDGALGAN
jgi:predicted small metal-binding protein